MYTPVSGLLIPSGVATDTVTDPVASPGDAGTWTVIVPLAVPLAPPPATVQLPVTGLPGPKSTVSPSVAQVPGVPKSLPWMTAVFGTWLLVFGPELPVPDAPPLEPPVKLVTVGTS